MALPSGPEAAALLVGAGALLLSVAGTLHAARWAWASPAPAAAWRPFATVVMPCKGEHPGFAANARALAGQAYPAYEVLFVLDDPHDPCAAALAALAAARPRAVRVLRTDPALAEGAASGKIAAMLTAVAAADPRSEALVFADADARPPPGWLAALVGPLGDPRVGGVTGYRWYHAAGAPTAWTCLRDAWNAVGLDALTMPRFRFLWGGSMAVRRADFERSAARAAWRRSVSDDVGLTRAIERLGLGIAFAPGAMVASPEDWPRDEVFAWVARQTAITRAAMPRLYAFAAAVYGGSVLLLAAGLGLALAWPSEALGLAGLAMLAPVASGVPRAWLRERAVRRALPGLAARPPRERLLQLALSLAVPLLMLWALARAARMDSIEWRGRRYPLAAP